MQPVDQAVGQQVVSCIQTFFRLIHPTVCPAVGPTVASCKYIGTPSPLAKRLDKLCKKVNPVLATIQRDDAVDDWTSCQRRIRRMRVELMKRNK